MASGLMRVLGRPVRMAHMAYSLWRVRNAPEYENPTRAEFDSIEADLKNLGIEIEPLVLDPVRFARFKSLLPFPPKYYGGESGGVWDEKLLEHFIAFERLGLEQLDDDEIYLDIAAFESPWASLLRNKLSVQAYAIDLKSSSEYCHLPYYMQGDATAMSFDVGGVKAASLQCAFEMFTGNSDVELIREFGRVLGEGGRCIISPLYMHTHYCGYSTADCFGRGYSDPGAVEYVRRQYRGIQFSRKYDALTLKNRILDAIIESGLRYRLLVLRNSEALGSNIYCHFILEILK